MKVASFLFVYSLFFFSIALLSESDGAMYFQNLNEKHGLPHNKVNAIIEDDLGFIWIGTNDGLCRLESPNRMKIFKVDPEIPEGLKSSNIRALLIDSQGIMWIGTRLGGLSSFDKVKNEWKTYIKDPEDPYSISDNEVLSIAEDTKGNLWVGTEYGLNLFDRNTQKFHTLVPDKTNPNALESRAVLSITIDDKGWMWVGTWDGALHLLMEPENGNYENAKFRKFFLDPTINSNDIWSIYQDNQKRYWIGTYGGGLYYMKLPPEATNKIDKQDWEADFTLVLNKNPNSDDLSFNDIKCVFQDNLGDLWIGSFVGLNKISFENLPSIESSNQKKLEIYYDANETTLKSKDISCGFQAKDGLIWFGSKSGANKYVNQKEFDVIPLADFSISVDIDENVFIDKNDKMWFLEKNNGLVCYDIKKDTTYIVQKFDSNLDNYFVSGDAENIYVSYREGLFIYNKSLNNITNIPYPDLFIQHNLFVTRVHIDKYENLWIASNIGLLLKEKSSGKFIDIRYDELNPNSISDNAITDLCEDSMGNMWIATYNGLNKIVLQDTYEEITFERYKSSMAENSLPSNRLITLKEIDNRLFMGSTQGLFAYDYSTNLFENFSKNENKSWIQSIEYHEGEIWLGTIEGLCRFNLKSKIFRHFDKYDGVSDTYFRVNRSNKNQEGKLFFVGRKELISFDSKKITKDLIPPKIHITDVKRLNVKGEFIENVIHAEEITLNHKDYHLTINFAALEYYRPYKIKYLYKLEGFDEDWMKANEIPSATYTNLEHGTYTFRVKAANNDGVWSEKGDVLTIVRKPALWERASFYIFCILGSLFLTIIGIKWYNRNLRLHNQQLSTFNNQLNVEINEREKVELALKEREQFLELVMDNIPQHIYWIDKKSQFLGLNKTVLNGNIKPHKKDVIGKHINEVFVPEDFVKKQTEYQEQVFTSGKAVLNNKIQFFNERIRVKEWFQQSFIPLKNNQQEIVGILISGENITEQVKAEDVLKMHSEKLEMMVDERTGELELKQIEIKKLLEELKLRNDELEKIVDQRTKKIRKTNEELKRSNSDLEQFAYMASHDLKEPLRVISGFIGLLNSKYNDRLDLIGLEYIAFIEDGAKRMFDIINSILTYSRVGNKEMNIIEVDLNSVVKEKIHDLSTLINEKNAVVDFRDLPELYCERTQLGMVFYNLINNGIKFNNNESPKVEIVCFEEKEYWEFLIKDNGIGILPEHQKKIFEIFKRLHSQTEYEGTGIGLAVCQKIIHRHGGEISVYSEIGIGTEFRFTVSKNLMEELQDLAHLSMAS